MTGPLDHSHGRRVLLIGGTSEIGLAIVEELQRHAPREVALLGRDGAGLEVAAASLRERAGVHRALEIPLEATRTGEHEAALERAVGELGGADIAVLAVGVLGERGALPDDLDAAVTSLEVNAVGAGSLLLRTARLLRDRGGGTIVVLSSVAAERPRRANAVYGAGKAALDALARGLGDELQDEGVRVLVARPGFVRTRMTRGLDPAPLACGPEDVAVAVYQALDGRVQTIWIPGPLRLMMLVLKLLPRSLFRRIRQ
jgi:decaprenylphospho-beta-D-erythro-pentofuranosid-2-ulose 2-reductase